jgi:hypothetical protein
MIPMIQDVFGQALRSSFCELRMIALELLALGIASGHHRRPLGDAQKGLPQPHAVRAGKAVEPLIGACTSLASVGKVMRHPLKIARP